jgi:hypothetical protein
MWLLSAERAVSWPEVLYQSGIDRSDGRWDMLGPVGDESTEGKGLSEDWEVGV